MKRWLNSVRVSSAIFQKMDTSMGLSSIASLSLGLSMSMTGTPGGAMMMRNLGVSAGPLQRLGGGPPAALHRSNNPSPSPRLPPNSATRTTGGESAQPDAATPSRQQVTTTFPVRGENVEITIIGDMSP